MVYCGRQGTLMGQPGCARLHAVQLGVHFNTGQHAEIGFECHIHFLDACYLQAPVPVRTAEQQFYVTHCWLHSDSLQPEHFSPMQAPFNQVYRCSQAQAKLCCCRTPATLRAAVQLPLTAKSILPHGLLEHAVTAAQMCKNRRQGKASLHTTHLCVVHGVVAGEQECTGLTPKPVVLPPPKCCFHKCETGSQQATVVLQPDSKQGQAGAFGSSPQALGPYYHVTPPCRAYLSQRCSTTGATSCKPSQLSRQDNGEGGTHGNMRENS